MGEKIMLAIYALLLPALAIGAEMFPGESALARSEAQRILLNPLENGVLSTGAYKMSKPSAKASDIPGKIGPQAVLVRGNANSGGAKGDFGLSTTPPGNIEILGLWVHIPENANVATVGLQIWDSENEAHFVRLPADWSGWRWVEFSLADAGWEQAFKQPQKNGKIDQPLKGVNFIWFAKEAGESYLTIDGLCCATILESDATAAGLSIRALEPEYAANENKLFRQILVMTNYTGAAVESAVRYRLQEDSALYDSPAPDPVLGSNLAASRPAWIEYDGFRREDRTLTDNDIYAAADIPNKAQGYAEVLQTIDLGKNGTISALKFRSGDANKAVLIDILASDDGENFAPTGPQKFDTFKKWGVHNIPVEKPFAARYLRLRHHKNGETFKDLGAPTELYVYSGADDETWQLPQTGRTVEEGEIRETVPARSFTIATVTGKEELPTGAYLAEFGSGRQLQYSNFFIMPPVLENVDASSRFGVNVADPNLAAINRRAGFGWVRFENMKWKMYNPTPDHFAFDGSVAPWNVAHEDYINRYAAAGLAFLPYIFQTPRWSDTSPEGTEKNQHSYPPKDYNSYKEAIFQVAARFGKKTHPAERLKTADKKSGLGTLTHLELWNEPNLNAPAWGFWIGSLEEYFELLRFGAEGAREGDPDMIISAAGYAGISIPLVDRLRTYKYADGKTPLDFFDIINVHYYSGRYDPETATDDPNVNRSGVKEEGARTYEDNLRALDKWRNDHKPGAEIWIGETGNDVGGPIGRSERYQAAKLPRCLMMALANGINKVMIYREKGSQPAHHGGAGLLRDDGSLRPSWFTVATMIRMLHGVKGKGLRLPHPDERARIYLWELPGGSQLITAWTANDEGDAIGLPLGECSVTDAFGKERKGTVGADFRLGIFPQYLTGFKQTPELQQAITTAKKRDADWLSLQDRLNKARAYAFDFGPAEQRVGAVTNFGDVRACIPVSTTDIFADNSGKQYGFTDKVGGKDEAYGWIRNDLACDAVRIFKEATFTFLAEAGEYEVELGVNLQKEPGSVIITDGTGKPQSFALTAGDNKVRALISGGTEPVRVKLEGGLKISWLFALEKVE